MTQTQMLYALIAVLGGIAVPILASVNAALGQSIGSVYWAALTLCAVAFAAIALIILMTASERPTMAVLRDAPWWTYFAGLFFTVYVVSITYVAPKIGVGNAIIFVVVAQIFTAVLIDHFGLFGAAVAPLDWKRVAGIVLLIAGIALARAQPPAPPGISG